MKRFLTLVACGIGGGFVAVISPAVPLPVALTGAVAVCGLIIGSAILNDLRDARRAAVAS